MMYRKFLLVAILGCMLCGIAAAEELRFLETIRIEGTVQMAAGDGAPFFYPDFPVVIYLVKSPDTLSQPYDAKSVKWITTVQTDSKGHFSYTFTNDQGNNPDATNDMLGYLVVMPQLTGTTGMENPGKIELVTAAASPDFIVKRQDSSPIVIFSVLDMWKTKTSEVDASLVWKVSGLKPIKTDSRGLTEPVKNEGMIAQMIAHQFTGPYIYIDIADSSSNYEYPWFFMRSAIIKIKDSTQHNASEPVRYNYISMIIRPDGTLWKYYHRLDDRSWFENVICKSGNSGVKVDITKCQELYLEKTNNFWEEYDDDLAVFSFAPEIDLIGKNDPPLAGQYLGFKPLNPQEIIYIKEDGSKADSSDLVARSINNQRIYADLLFLGNCDRSGQYGTGGPVIDYKDLSAIQAIAGKPELFDTICDMNGDRVIDNKDIDLLIDRIKNGRMGDCNGDYRFDDSDIGYIKNLIGKEYPRYECDMNGDQKITQTDVDLLTQKLGSTGTYGKQSSSTGGNQSSSGSFIPEGDGNTLPRDKKMVLPANEEGQVRPFSIIDAIISIPHTIMSVFEVSGSESSGSGTQEGTTATVIKIHQEEPASPPPDSVKVAVLDEGKEKGTDTVIVNDVVRPEVVISDSSSGTSTNENGGTLKEARVVLPETTAMNRAEIAQGMLICPPDQRACNGICRDVSSDRYNCGACGFQCESAYVCTQGTCTPFCNSGLTSCNGACVSLQTDTANCGSCGHVCISGVPCTNGQCVAQVVTPQPTRLGSTGIRMP